MMRRTFLFCSIVGIFSILAIPFVQADYAKRIQIDEVINRTNIVITNPQTDEKTLIHLRTSCGALKAGQNVTLIVKGGLNSNGDMIKLDAWHKCRIDFAEPFDQRLYVDYVFSNKTQARVKDEAGKLYFITYSDFCRSMPGYWKNYVYAATSRDGLKKGNKIFLPNKDGQCSIDFVREIPPRLEEVESDTADEDPDADKRVPTTVVGVKAFPGNGKAYLSWKPAKDNVGISHYIVGSSRYQITNTKDMTPGDMPNQTQTEKTSVTIEDLDNDETWFFYVLAVDTSGNVSSRWSRAAQAIPKGSILSDTLVPSGSQSLNLRIDRESKYSFLIRWDPIQNTSRYTVIFEKDGELEFSRTEYPRRSIRILKRSDREGKELTLKVRAHSLRDMIGEEEIEFEF